MDASNVIGVILSVNDGFYKIGTKQGQINSLFSRNQIFECKESFLTPEDVPKGKDISIRSVSLQTSPEAKDSFIVSAKLSARQTDASARKQTCCATLSAMVR